MADAERLVKVCGHVLRVSRLKCDPQEPAVGEAVAAVSDAVQHVLVPTAAEGTGFKTWSDSVSPTSWGCARAQNKTTYFQ